MEAGSVPPAALSAADRAKAAALLSSAFACGTQLSALTEAGLGDSGAGTVSADAGAALLPASPWKPHHVDAVWDAIQAQSASDVELEQLQHQFSAVRATSGAALCRLESGGPTFLEFPLC